MSLTSVTSTFAVTLPTDSSPSLSLATTSKALLPAPKSFKAGVQYALFEASIVSFAPAAQSTAVPALAPIFNVVLAATDLTTKASTVPSTSAASLAPKSTAKVISTSVSSRVVLTGLVRVVNVGMSLTAVTVILKAACGVSASCESLTVNSKLSDTVSLPL